MTTMQIALSAGAVVVLLGLWQAQRSRHPFNLFDTLMDQATGKASLNALILAVMALLAAWVVIDREQAGKDDVPSLLAMVLGIFVAGRATAQAIAAFKPMPDLGSTLTETVRETETVKTAATAATPPKE